MGASPKQAAEKKKVEKWVVRVTYEANRHTYGGGRVEVDAPTESEILAALYQQNKYCKDIKIIKIEDKGRITKWE